VKNIIHIRTFELISDAYVVSGKDLVPIYQLELIAHVDIRILLS